MSGFVKTCIVHNDTQFFNFGDSQNLVWITDTCKTWLGATPILLSSYKDFKSVAIAFPVVAIMHLQMSKVGYVNYAPFLFHSHIKLFGNVATPCAITISCLHYLHNSTASIIVLM